MALELNIISYQNVGASGGQKPGERIAKATFRGKSTVPTVENCMEHCDAIP